MRYHFMTIAALLLASVPSARAESTDDKVPTLRAPIVDGKDLQPKPPANASRKPDPEVQQLLSQNPDHKSPPPPHDLYGQPLGSDTTANPPAAGNPSR